MAAATPPQPGYLAPSPPLASVVAAAEPLPLRLERAVLLAPAAAPSGPDAGRRPTATAPVPALPRVWRQPRRCLHHRQPILAPSLSTKAYKESKQPWRQRTPLNKARQPAGRQRQGWREARLTRRRVPALSMHVEFIGGYHTCRRLEDCCVCKEGAAPCGRTHASASVAELCLKIHETLTLERPLGVNSACFATCCDKPSGRSSSHALPACRMPLPRHCTYASVAQTSALYRARP